MSLISSQEFLFLPLIGFGSTHHCGALHAFFALLAFLADEFTYSRTGFMNRNAGSTLGNR